MTRTFLRLLVLGSMLFLAGFLLRPLVIGYDAPDYYTFENAPYSEYAYLLYTSGTTYCSRNMETGLVSNGTDANTVIQNVADNAPLGSSIFFKSGVYTDVAVTFTKPLRIIGEQFGQEANSLGFGVDIRPASNSYAFNFTFTTTYRHGVELTNLFFSLEDNEGIVYLKNVHHPILKNIMSDCWTDTNVAGAIYVTGTGGFGIFENIRMRRLNNTGIFIDASAGMYDLNMMHLVSTTTNTGSFPLIEFENNGGNVITGGELANYGGTCILLDRTSRNTVSDLWFEHSKFGINITDQSGSPDAYNSKQNVLEHCHFVNHAETYYHVMIDYGVENKILYPDEWGNCTNTDNAVLFTSNSIDNLIRLHRQLQNVNHDISGTRNRIVDDAVYVDSQRANIIPETYMTIFNGDDMSWNIYNGTHWLLPDGTVT